MSVELKDVAVAEFNALRAEILARYQFQGNVVAAALTILAAVGGFALAKGDGRIEMLLVLPLVLSGLGVLVVDVSAGSQRIGLYISECLWTRLPESTTGRFASWEHFISAYRQQGWWRLSRVGMGTLPFVFILVLPSIASLWITCAQMSTSASLWPLWWGGAIAVVLFALLALSLLKAPKMPDSNGNPAPEGSREDRPASDGSQATN